MGFVARAAFVKIYSRKSGSLGMLKSVTRKRERGRLYGQLCFGDAGLNKVNQVSSLQGFRVLNMLMYCRTLPLKGESRRKHYLQNDFNPRVWGDQCCDHSGKPPGGLNLGA